jgi:DNA primase
MKFMCEAVTPETRAGIWARLDAMARSVRDDETRAGYLSAWRVRFEAAFPLVPEQAEVPTYVVTRLGGERPLAMPATSGTQAEDGDYIWPDDDQISFAKLHALITRAESLMAERNEIAAEIRDVFAMAKIVGFDAKAMRRLIAERAQDVEARQSVEASLVLYRRLFGVQGPLDAAMLPPVIDVRAKLMNSPQAKRSARIGALIDMRRVS